jgi:DNA-binding GntR family transcriptional regulator
MESDSVPPPCSNNGSEPATAAAKAKAGGSNLRSPDEGPRDYIVREIVSGLYDGRYEPGERLLESDLTAAYAASRGPVREALNRLSVMGIIVLVPQRGAQVRRLSIGEAIDMLEVVRALVGVSARRLLCRVGRFGTQRRTQPHHASRSNPSDPGTVSGRDAQCGSPTSQGLS